MECRTLIFLVIICLVNFKQKFSVIRSYYLIQILGSSLFLVSLIIIRIPGSIFYNIFSSLIYNFSLCIKLGLFPFHMWVLNLVMEINWIGIFMLASFQKFIPILMLSWGLLFNYIFFVSFLTMLIRLYNRLGLVSLKLIFTYSMLSHRAWIRLILAYLNWWLIYFLLYSFLFFLLCYFNYFLDIEDFGNLNVFKNYSLFMLLMYLLNLISLMGIPPFTGFIIKWIIIDILLNNLSYYFLLFTIIITSVVHLYIYIRVILWSFINFSRKRIPIKYFIQDKLFNINLYFMFSFFINFYIIYIVLLKL